jgi:hypothetical protein
MANQGRETVAVSVAEPGGEAGSITTYRCAVIEARRGQALGTCGPDLVRGDNRKEKKRIQPSTWKCQPEVPEASIFILLYMAKHVPESRRERDHFITICYL